MLLSVGLSNGAVTWTGASDTNIFNGANYNGLADGLELGPNVTISTMSLFKMQPSQFHRFQLNSVFRLDPEIRYF